MLELWPQRAAFDPDLSLLLVAGLALAILLGWLLVRRQHGQSAPLVPVDLFASRAFTLAVATSFCSFMTQMLAFVSLPFFLDRKSTRLNSSHSQQSRMPSSA